MRSLSLFIIVTFVCVLSTLIIAENVPNFKQYYTAQPGSNASKHILFTGIPMPGHVFPLLATAEQLATQGYTVTVATLKSLERVVLGHKHELYVDHVLINDVLGDGNVLCLYIVFSPSWSQFSIHFFLFFFSVIFASFVIM